VTVAASLRIKNYTQISTKEIVVSGTQQSVNHAGLRDLLAYQIMKAGKELKRDIEASILSKNPASAGAVNTGRKSAGIIAYCETSLMIKGGTQTTPTCTAWAASGIPDSDATIGAAASATALDTTDLLTALQVAWTNGGETDVILTSAALRTRITTFTGIATRFSDVTKGQEAVITQSADVFVSQFGAHKIITSRDSLAGTVYCLQTDMFGVAYLRPMQTVQIAKSGDSEKRLLLAEWTLVNKNHTASTILVNRT
jgi:hypothetical protein